MDGALCKELVAKGVVDVIGPQARHAKVHQKGEQVVAEPRLEKAWQACADVVGQHPGQDEVVLPGVFLGNLVQDRLLAAPSGRCLHQAPQIGAIVAR